MSQGLRGQPVAQFLEAVEGTEIEPNGDFFEFYMGPCPGYAYHKQGVSRIRGSVFLAEGVNPLRAHRWIAKQPPPKSGLLDVVEGTTDGTYDLRLLFERPSNQEPSPSDPLILDVLDYCEAWHSKSDVEDPDEDEPFAINGDPLDIEPANAWLLMGSEESFPSEQDVLLGARKGRVGIFDCRWTTAKQTQVGDLALVYFMAPRKAVHFVARAASRAFFDATTDVASDHKVSKKQWWAYFTPLVEIDPFTHADLVQHAGGFLPLKGKGGLYLRPETIAGLPRRAHRPEDQAALDRVLVTPVGQADLPRADDVTLDMWPLLASGAMPLEAHVSQHVVEPLLRFALDGTSLTWQREYPVGKKWADYVVLDGHSPRCVVEVKLAIKESPDGIWTKSADFTQMMYYATALGCPGVLIDANRVLLVARGADEPYRIIERREATVTDLQAIRRHVVGSTRHSTSGNPRLVTARRDPPTEA